MHLFTQSAFLKALGWSLFNSLWQMALLWLCYILLTALFRKISSHVRHGLAILLLGAGTIAFLVTFLNSYSSAESGQSLSGWLPSIHGVRQTINQFLPYCSSLYLLALTFLFIRYSNHYLYSRRMKAEGLSKVQPTLRLFVKETAQRMGIVKEVRVWLSSLVEGPVTLGFLRPVILIPVAMVNNLSVAQVEAILLHELAHIKRYDYLMNLGVTVVGILFFFNPFTRLIIRDIRREREHRCDDLVLQFQYDPHAYVSALLSLAAPTGCRQTLALAATGKSDRLLLYRVRRILKQQRTGEWPGARPVIFLLFTMLTAMIGMSGTVSPIARLIQRNKTTNEPVVAAFPRSPFETQAPTIWSYVVNKSQTAKKATDPKKKTMNEDGEEDLSIPPQDLLYASNSDNGDSAGENATYVLSGSGSGPSDAREYSIQQAPEATVVMPTPSADNETAPMPPYVQGSSFSYRVTEDSTTAMQQLGVLIESEGKATELKLTITKAIASNEADIKKSLDLVSSQRQALANLRSASLCRQSGLNLRKQCIEKQLRIQRVKLSQQVELQNKLLIAIAKLRIVHI